MDGNPTIAGLISTVRQVIEESNRQSRDYTTRLVTEVIKLMNALDGNRSESSTQAFAGFIEILGAQNARIGSLEENVAMLSTTVSKLKEKLASADDEDEPWRESLRPDGDGGEDGE